MTDAPEQIWAFRAPEIEEDNPECTIVAGENCMHGAQSYTRTDIAQAQIGAALEQAKREARKQALLDAASVAMDKWEDVYNPDCGEAVKGILALIENGEE